MPVSGRSKTQSDASNHHSSRTTVAPSMRPVYRFITTNDEYIVTLVEKGGSFAAFFHRWRTTDSGGARCSGYDQCPAALGPSGP